MKIFIKGTSDDIKIDLYKEIIKKYFINITEIIDDNELCGYSCEFNKNIDELWKFRKEIEEELIITTIDTNYLQYFNEEVMQIEIYNDYRE